MKKLALALLMVVWAAPAWATCGTAANGVPHTPAYLLSNEFQDGQPAGSITPGCMRDEIATLAINALSLKNAGLPTGGDDTAAINAVLAAAKTAGVAVYAPAGIYKHQGLTGGAAGDIIVDSVCLYGDGPSTIFQSTDTTSTNPDTAIKIIGTNPCLRSLAITSTWAGARQGNPDGQAIYNTSTGFTIRDVTITGGAAGGIFNFGASNGRIESNQIFSTLADGIHVTSGAHDIVETNNYESAPGDDCFAVVSYGGDPTISYNIRIENNTCLNGAARGAAVVGGQRIEVVGNIFDTPTAFCLYAVSESNNAAYPDDGVSLVGNTCNHAATIGNQESAVLVDGHTTAITASIATNILTVSVATANTVQVGAYVTGSTVPVGTQIASNGTGTGGTGTYNLSNTPGTITSRSMTLLNEATNILVQNNNLLNVVNGGINVGTAVNVSTGVIVSNNRIVGISPAVNDGAGIFVNGTTDLTIMGNQIKNFGYAGIADNGTNGNTGYLTIIGNTFDAVGTNGEFAVDLQASTFTSAVISGNTQFNDGITPSGCLRVGGITSATIRDNYCDMHTGDAITSLTMGEYYNPFVSDVLYGVPRLMGQTKFTVASGCGTTTTLLGGATYGSFHAGQAACAAVIVMNGASGMTAPTGWTCVGQDVTTPADIVKQTASTTTTATFGGTVVSGDTINFHCDPY